MRCLALSNMLERSNGYAFKMGYAYEMIVDAVGHIHVTDDYAQGHCFIGFEPYKLFYPIIEDERNASMGIR